MKELDYRSETLKQDLYDVARRREWDERLTRLLEGSMPC